MNQKPSSPAVNHRGVNLHEPEPAPGNRAAFLADHPAARQLHEAHMAEFRAKFSALVDGLKPMLHGIVAKADLLWEVGIVMLEWCEQSLPGGKLTRDLYEQHKAEFVDARGQTAGFEFLEAAVKCARENLEPIDNLHTALKYKQPMLLATGDAEFVLESVPPPQKSVAAADPLKVMKDLLNPSSMAEAWQNLRANGNYFQDGHLRDTLRETLVEQWRPTFQLMDELRKELGI